MDILLRDVHILDSAQPQNIVVEGREITDVGPAAHLPDPEYEITGEHLFVTPTLANAHTHTPMTLLRGYSDNKTLFPWLQEIWSIEKHFRKDECRVGAELAFLEMIKGGTGLFVDFYFNEDAVMGAAEEAGLRGYLGAAIIEGAFLSQGGSEWMMGLAEDLCKRLANHPTLGVMVAPHAPHTCSEETLTKSLSLADKYQVPVTIHASETRDDVLQHQKDKGLPPVEWLDKKLGFFTGRQVLVAHSVWVQQREVELMAERGAAMAFCPVSGQKLAYGGMAPIPEFLEHNVPVCLATDGPASNNTLDMVREMRAAATMISHQRWDPTVVNARQVLDMTTAHLQQWLTGTRPEVRPGHPADLTVFDLSTAHTWPVLNPVSTLVYAANGSNAHSLVVGGKLLMQDRVVLTLDEVAVKQRARETVDDLMTLSSSEVDMPTS